MNSTTYAALVLTGSLGLLVGVVLGSEPTSAAPTVKGIRFEYRILTVHPGLMNSVDDAQPLSQAKMNELGTQGFQFVGDHGTYVYLERVTK